MRNCTLLILSCDAYEDAWIPYFTLLEKFWIGFDMPIILNTETKHFSYKHFDVRTYSMYKKGEYVPWGKRLLDHLNKVTTDFIYVVCEDYFLRENVIVDKMGEMIDIIEKDEKISNIFPQWVPITTRDDSLYEDFELRTKEYRFCCGGLWRTNHLKQYIFPHESPWEFEIEGNSRANLTSNKFYSLKYGVTGYCDHGFTYNWMGLKKGKWVIEDVEPLFLKHNIKVNFNSLGITHQDTNKWENAIEEYKNSKKPLLTRQAFRIKQVILMKVSLKKKLSLLIRELPPLSWFKKLLKRKKENGKTKIAREQVYKRFGDCLSIYDLL